MTIAQLSEAEQRSENDIARKNAWLYSLCQAFTGSSAPISIALGGLAGAYLLGTDKSLATAPVTGFNVGVALAALPAAMIMRRIGRRLGFMAGAVIGIAGLLVAAGALILHSFWLFCLGLLLTGSANGFAQQFRFAAADRGTPAFRAKAISIVLIGGVAAAIIGPQVVLWTRDLLSPIPFAGAFLAGTLLFGASLVTMSFIDSRPVSQTGAVGEEAEAARPLAAIMSQPKFIVAVLCAIGSYSMMSLVMTAAPLAMIGCGFSIDDATLGIQWHVLAMFAPSFFTGNLIARFGKERVIATGMAILSGCAAVALAGITLANFWGALVLLGVGWNFAFIGSTAMITETYRPSEKSKAQGANDLLLFGSVALASLMSGHTLETYGWQAVNLIVFPVVLLCLAALGWLASRKRNQPEKIG
ncbi:MAG: MFS transporter [Nitratireductor sp.]|nr:MFS transporter [Nitratireductor sp.]